jgi:uncharacterized membrane protein YphA (DoxX/SURF4 family)
LVLQDCYDDTRALLFEQDTYTEGDRIMNIVLWVLQVLLALVFLFSGAKKLIRSNEQIHALPWARDLSPRVVRGIGSLEVLGAIGVILPVLTGILPWLMPLAAVGLAVLMLGAAWINVRLALYPAFAANLMLLALAALVAYGRMVFIAV